MRYPMSVLLAAWVVIAVCAGANGAAAPATRPAVEPARPILSPEQRREAARMVIDRFVEHVNASAAASTAAKAAISRGWAERRNDPDPSEFMTAGVAILSEPYKTALAAIEKQDYAQADAALRLLLKDPDAYVSLHASALLARSLVEQEKLEQAEQLLTPLAAREKELIERSFLEADVDFLLGYSQLANLHYDEARATLERFERQHADAPERLRLPARQMLQELAGRRPESLGEVSDLMVYAGRQLAHGQTDKPVQTQQERAVELLNKLIKDAEDQEQQQSNKDNQGGGGGGAQGRQSRPNSNQRSANPAEQSTLPEGQGRIGELHRSGQARPGEEWGKMPPEERERVLQSLRRNFPSQYRQLVEQYYKQLAKEK